MSAPDCDNPPEIPHLEALEHSQRALDETQALYRVAQTLLDFKDLPELLQTIVDIATEALSANRVTLITFDLETHRVTHFVKGGPGIHNIVGVSFDELWDGLSGWTLRELKPVLSPKDIPDPRESLQVQQRRLETRAGSIIVVPVCFQNKLLGTMTAINCPEERDFNQRDVDLMMAVASHGAIAIENARLYNALQSANEELERGIAERTAELAETNARLRAEIVQYKQLELALRESESRYRQVFDNVSDCLSLLEVTEDGRFRNLEVNLALERSVGLSRTQLIGKTQDETVSESTAQVMNAKYRHCVQIGVMVEEEVELELPTGHRCYQSFLIPVRDDTGRIYRIIAISRDITEQRQTENILHENERQFRLLAENSTDLISRHSPDGTYLYVSPSCRTLLGYEPDDLIGHSAYEFFYPSDVVAIRQSHAAIVEQPLTYTVQYRIRRKDGQYIWFETTSRTIRDSQTEAVVEIQAASRDISKRKQAEEALQRSNQRLSTLHHIDRQILVASSPGAMADTVLQHLVELIPCDFISINLYNDALTEERMLALWHTPNISIHTDTIMPTVENKTHEGVKSGQLAITADLNLEEGPLPPLAKDLMAQGVHAAMAQPMIAQGRLVGVIDFASMSVGFFTPEHQQIAEEIATQVAIALRQAELNDQIARHNVELEQRVRERTTQLESANRELELFSYSVSHDLRAPLRAIQGFAEIIARRHRDSLNEEGRRYFNHIVTASEQMNQLIIDLLDYARLGRQHIRIEAIPVSGILQEVTDNLTPRIQETGALIHITHSLPSVLGDKTLLMQIFTNLLENALLYYRPGIFPIVRVSCSLEAGYALIRVADNGIGIPPEFREKIFNIFQRLHNQDQYPGTGIGLAVVRKSVEMLNGTIWVESGNMEGSTFCVKLPCPTQ